MGWSYNDIPSNSYIITLSKNTCHLKINGHTNAPITFPKKLRYLYVYGWSIQSEPLVLTKYLDYLSIQYVHEHKIFLEYPMSFFHFSNYNIFIKDNLSDSIEICMSRYLDDDTQSVGDYIHVRDKQLDWEHYHSMHENKQKWMDAITKINKNYPLG